MSWKISKTSIIWIFCFDFQTMDAEFDYRYPSGERWPKGCISAKLNWRTQNQQNHKKTFWSRSEYKQDWMQASTGRRSFDTTWNLVISVDILKEMSANPALFMKDQTNFLSNYRQPKLELINFHTYSKTGT